MKFALFILASWLEKDTRAQSRIYDEALEQVEYAEELGFDSVWTAEIYGADAITPLAFLAAHTRYLRLENSQPIGFKLLDVLPQIELFNLMTDRGLVSAHCRLSLLLFHTL